MHKKILFLTLIILFITLAFTDASILTVKGKLGYNLTINVLNSLNNESSIPSPILTNIGSSGQTNVEFASGTAKANIVVIARVSGKIAKKKELYNVNVQATTPIIIDLLDIPTPPPAPSPSPSSTPTLTPSIAPSPTPAQSPTPIQSPSTASSQPSQTLEDNEKESSFLTGWTVNLSPTLKKTLVYSSAGLIIIILIIILIILLTKKRKRKLRSEGDFKVTKLSHLSKESEPEDIEEAEKRLRVAREEIDRINEILNKRRAIKEAESKLEEERKALERLKKGFR